MAKPPKRRPEDTDAEWLFNQPQFRRFLWRLIQRAGIWDATADGSERATGRRNLGLEILDMVEKGQPHAHDAEPGPPMLTVFGVLREEIQKPTQESNNDQGYNRNAELDDRTADDDQAD
jgi:hypothetical protein